MRKNIDIEVSCEKENAFGVLWRNVMTERTQKQLHVAPVVTKLYVVAMPLQWFAILLLPVIAKTKAEPI